MILTPVAAPHASYYHLVQEGTGTTLCHLPANRMSETGAASTPHLCAACQAVRDMLAPDPAVAVNGAVEATPLPGFRPPEWPPGNTAGRPEHIHHPGSQPHGHRESDCPGPPECSLHPGPSRGADMTEPQPPQAEETQAYRPPDRYATQKVLDWVRGRPGEHTRRPIAAATGVAESSVGNILDRAIKQRELPGLSKPRRGHWHYQSADVPTRAEPERPIDRHWELAFDAPTDKGEWIARGIETGRPYVFRLM